MSWIKTIPFNKADSKLRSIYKRVKGPNDTIDNVLMIHGLRPHTLVGHMTLYKSVLHHSANTLPKWYLECIGVYVSYLNKCDYCVQHHSAGLSRLFNDSKKEEQFFKALRYNTLDTFFDTKYLAGVHYAKKLTIAPSEMVKTDFTQLKEVGFTEGEILEINQVTSYFNYVNRSVLGLGVDTQGDIIGLSPNESDDVQNWNHS
ncbi:MAG: peroxidase-related enzyme [Maribacter sp.]|nr:peroxidase-related enzyme [Maribacter sp.]